MPPTVSHRNNLCRPEFRTFVYGQADTRNVVQPMTGLLEIDRKIFLFKRRNSHIIKKSKQEEARSMANLMDYLNWRGDLTFIQAPFNEVDSLIFSELAYADFREIVPGVDEKGGVPLREAVEQFFDKSREKELRTSVLLPEKIPDMLKKMSGCVRFQDLLLSCCEEHLDEVRREQFAAITVELPGRMAYLAFRGTDDTLVGWRTLTWPFETLFPRRYGRQTM